MLILFVYTFFIQSKQSSHVFLQNNHDIFVKSPKTGASLVLAFCLPCLCLFGYDTQRYNIIIIKQFLKSFFLRNTCIPRSLPSTTRPETQSFCSYFNFFGMLPVLLCQIGPLSMDQLLFRHHKSMTHDTYDTCFYNLFTRAQERRKIYIIYIKKRKQKVSKTGVTGVMCHRNGIYRMWVCD